MSNSRETDYNISNNNNTIEALKKMFRGGVDRQFGIQRCKLAYTELTDNKVLIYSSGNYIQYPVINHTHTHTHVYRASQVALVVKNSPANAGDIRDTGFIPGLGRSSGGGKGNPLQYSCLGNPVDRGA